MRRAFRLAIPLIIICSPILAFPQTTTSITVSPPGDGRVAEWMYGEHITAVPSLPFTAKVELEMVNLLQDGTQIIHKTYNLDARDSLGRTRNEARNWINPAVSAEPRLIRIELYAPATKTRINLFPLTKTAKQWTVNAGFSTTTASTLPASSKPTTSKEDIGTDIMEGLRVRGVRVTQTHQPEAVGSDRPLTIVTEYWYSEDLKINLLTKRTDPRYGVQTVRVTELARQEPGASLFAIPEDYRMITETVQPQRAQGSSSPLDTLPANSTNSSVPVRPGIARAGVDGVTAPYCLFCPNPTYSNEARAAKVQGVVVLSIVVSADGQAEDVQPVKGPGSGLEQKAIEMVETWRFKPATDPDGRPVACTVMVSVTFKLG